MTTRAQDERPDVTAAYRAASALLDERPDVSARASILAAAARAVGAGPAPLGANPFRRYRWPLAAAATLLVSSVAVIVAQRTGQEIGNDRLAQATVDPPAPATPPPLSAVSQTQAEPAAAPLAAAPVAPARATDPVAPPAPRAAPARPTAPSPVPGSEPRAESAEAQSAGVTAQAKVTDDAALDRQPARGAGSVAAPARDAAGQREGAARAPLAVAPAPPAEQQVIGRPVARSGPLDDALWRADPQRWIDRIIELRRLGRDDEADAELKLLRERHPQLRVPEAVLRGEVK